MGAVSILEDSEFQREVVQRCFGFVYFSVYLFCLLTTVAIKAKQTREMSEAVLCAFIVSVAYRPVYKSTYFSCFIGNIIVMVSNNLIWQIL